MNILYWGDFWDSKWRRRQQVASRLALNSQVTRVIYVEYPITIISFFRFIFNCADLEATFRWKRIFKKGFLFCQSTNKLLIFTPIVFWGQFNESRIFNKWMLFFQLRFLKKYEYKKNLVATPYWDSNFLFKNFGKIDIYDVTEDFSEVDEKKDFKMKQISLNDYFLTKIASNVVCSSTLLFSNKRNLNKNVFLIQNGIDIELFRKEQKSFDFREQLKLSKDSVLLGYSGDTNIRFDWNLIKEVLSLEKRIVLLVIGKISSRNKKIKRVISLGEWPYNKVPFFLKNIDICIVPHKIDNFSNSMSPLKLGEYIALSKPIISTNINGISDLMLDLGINNKKDLNISCVKDSKAFVKAIWHSMEKRKVIKSINTINKKSWGKKMYDFERILFS
jgi:glycosyltransferase involved in cell wall biosynthesis